MVAITVVLAAVLYVMVTQMVTTTEIPPKVTFSRGESTGVPGQYRLDVAGVDKTDKFGNFKVAIVKNGTVQVLAATAVGTGVVGTGTTVQYNDANSDGKISGGDRFIISGCAAGSDFELQLFYKTVGLSGTGTFTSA
jgi:FlaG/FlaF family flagellin (archaellin)